VVGKSKKHGDFGRNPETRGSKIDPLNQRVAGSIPASSSWTTLYSLCLVLLLLL
jgi:hypothetical protein